MAPDPNPITLPNAIYDPYPNKNQTPVQVDFLVLHTEVGTNEGSIQIGGQDGHSYAHNYVDCLGTTFQKQSLRYRSAACLEANPYAIAWETEDMDSRCFPVWGNQCGNVPAWTDAQCERLAQDLAYCCLRFNVPAELVPDTKLGRRGICYHRQGVPDSPEWVDGALKMSMAKGKCCPDWRRIEQITKRIIPRVRELIASAIPPEETEMMFDLLINKDDRTVPWAVTAPGFWMSLDDMYFGAGNAGRIYNELVRRKLLPEAAPEQECDNTTFNLVARLIREGPVAGLGTLMTLIDGTVAPVWSVLSDIHRDAGIAASLDTTP